jgi:hypothetical protein
MMNDLELLVTAHFTNALSIRALQEEQKDNDRELLKTLMTKEATEFFSINWKALHREFMGSTKR